MPTPPEGKANNLLGASLNSASDQSRQLCFGLLHKVVQC
jgi:hypothetical protein